jgi:predicted  nucleic acid-binding Zn-ribbon protein
MHQQMSLLRELQAIDSYIDRLRQELNQLDSGERIRAKLEQTRQRMEDIKQRYEASYAAAAEQERRLQELDERIRRAEAELYSGRITNPRELQLMQQEIENAKKTRDELDLQMLQLWETLENMKRDIDASERDLRQIERFYEAHMEDYRQRKAALEGEIAFNEQEREKLAQQIDPEVRQRYQTLRERLGGIAVAVVEQKACSVCHTLLTPYTLKRLETEEALITCESCGRLLYDPNLVK